MPTVLTHAALPLIAAWGLRAPRRLAIAAAIVALAPDVDVVGRAFAIPHQALLGHRGISHSLLFALLLAMLAWTAIARDRPKWSLAFLFAAAASHGLADMYTRGSKGIMLWWPLAGARYEWQFQPVEASGILARSVTGGALPAILLAELLWLVLPAFLLAALCRLARRPYIDLR